MGEEISARHFFADVHFEIKLIILENDFEARGYIDRGDFLR